MFVAAKFLAANDDFSLLLFSWDARFVAVSFRTALIALASD